MPCLPPEKECQAFGKNKRQHSLTLTIITEVTVSTIMHELSSVLVGCKGGDRGDPNGSLRQGIHVLVRSWVSVGVLSIHSER